MDPQSDELFNVVQDWWDRKGLKLLGSDAGQDIDDVIGSDNEDEVDYIGQNDDFDGPKLAHTTGGAVTAACSVTADPDKPVQGEITLLEPATDPLYFVKLAEARGTVRICVLPKLLARPSLVNIPSIQNSK